jgi:L-lactate dehydrogenase complex protein LldG
VGVALVTDARAEVLARIGRALGAAPVVPAIPRAYRQAGSAEGTCEVVELFAQRAAEYRATVVRTSAAGLARTINELCARRGVRRMAVARGAVAPEGIEAVADDPPLAPRDLDALDGVVTGCALAIAETGTIVLDGSPESGRRASTLVPDYHVCVVRESQIVRTVPDAIAGLAETGLHRRPLTFVSGPSATSDIELDRVEGVHGPRTLDIVVVADEDG